MWQKDEKLLALQQKVARKKYLKKLLDDLRAQEKELKERIRLLDAERKREQGEADRIQGKSLSSFFYAIAGKKDEILAKEQREALAASAKYDAALAELNAVREDIKRYNAEYKTLIGYDVQFSKLLREKEKALKAAGEPEAKEIVRLERQMAENDSSIHEAQQAYASGVRAQRAACRVLDALNNSDTWASWDVLGGGMVADHAKRDKLDDAQDAVGELQVELRRFKTELSDIGEDSKIKANAGSFLRFADWFFDGVFVDYSILQKIEEAKERVSNILHTVEDILFAVQEKINTLENENAKLQAQLDTLVFDTEI